MTWQESMIERIGEWQSKSTARHIFAMTALYVIVFGSVVGILAGIYLSVR